jgi:hypothetical protein
MLGSGRVEPVRIAPDGPAQVGGDAGTLFISMGSSRVCHCPRGAAKAASTGNPSACRKYREDQAALRTRRKGKMLEPKPLPRQQPLPEIASAPSRHSSPPERPRIDPDLKSRPAQELTLEPRRVPAQPVPTRESGPPPVLEPGQQQEPAPESSPAPPPISAQAAQEPSLMGEPAPPEAPEPTSPQPPTLEPTEETASLPKPSLVEPTPDPPITRSADEAPLTTSDLFSPEPIATKPAIILSRDDQPDERFDEELEHGRSEITRTPRWLREPSPPLLLSDGEP